MTFSNRLKTLRNVRGIRQEELARITGIPTNYLSGMETGKITPSNELEERIRLALNWTPEVDAQLDAITQASA